MTSKAEWQRRAAAAEEKLDSAYAERLELHHKVQELTQEVERLADDNAVPEFDDEDEDDTEH